MSWTDKVWKCVCGFTTHNEHVWIEHLNMHINSSPLENHKLIIEGKQKSVKRADEL